MNNFQPKTLFIGKNCIYLPSCHSTNDIAHEIIQSRQAFDGTIVITDHQTAGRGQRGNSWEAMPNQNITVSFILKPEFLQANQQFQLNIAVSLAINEFLKKYLPHDLKIKWPNDVYFGDKKMGGILIENTLSGSHLNFSIIGIGLNINQLDFLQNNATSLRKESNNRVFEINSMIEELCIMIEKQYLLLKKGNTLFQKKAYLDHLFRYEEIYFYKINEEIFSGKIIGIEENGKLILEIVGEIRSFDLKEISFVI